MTLRTFSNSVSCLPQNLISWNPVARISKYFLSNMTIVQWHLLLLSKYPYNLEPLVTIAYQNH